MRPVRVRFAPSPTGYLHVGNVRTALFNWLFARKHGGAFILRIEDTDIERSDPRYEAQLMEDLRWLGLDWDEGVDVGGDYGPYRQTDRFEIYQSYAAKLIKEGKAYYCFCTPEELELERRSQLAQGRMPKYSGKCRDISPDEAERRLAQGQKAAVRLRVRDGTVGFDDLVFGRIQIDCSIVSDPVLLRSDGRANYNYSCVIDDHLMRISHVIRGEGHISNTHRQVLIYEALGVLPPAFAHLSTVLGKDGEKLSKRHGATSIEEFRELGYLPEALLNYLALLGWSPPEEGKEIMPLEEIVRGFSLERVSKSPAIFDMDKLNWMNRSYVRAADTRRLVDLCKGYFIAAGLIPEGADRQTEEWLALVIDAVKGYVDNLSQIVSASEVIFSFEPEALLSSDELRQELRSPEARAVIAAFYQEIKDLEALDLEDYKAAVSRVKEKTGQKGKKLFHPIRVALTARASGPELDKLVQIFEMGKLLDLPIKILGCRERIQATLKVLEKFEAR